MKVKDLKPAAYNPRTITDEKLSALGKSMKEYGDLSGIVRNIRTGNLVGGHQRIKHFDPLWAIKKRKHEDNTGTVALGEIETPFGVWSYREVDWPEKREKAANVSANQSGGLFDYPALQVLFDEINDGTLDMEMIGFDEGELKNILEKYGDQAEPKDAEPQIDQAEELNKVWGVKTGDLWQIGHHRLLCGDSTKKEDVGRVMGGEKADCVLTDPPYGIEWDGDYTRFTKKTVKTCSSQYDEINGDAKPFDPTPWLAFDSVILWGANFYAGSLPVGSWLVWDKRSGDGTSFLADAELAWQKGGKGCYIKSINQQAEVSRLRDIAHPTKKPVALFVWCIERLGDGSIYDPFLGSGTTMVACQNLNRKCRGIEISPDYCAVILQRMKDAFGITGIRV